MPGIFGCVERKEAKIPEKIAEEMANSLNHECRYSFKWFLNRCLLGSVQLESVFGSTLSKDEKIQITGVLTGYISNKTELNTKFELGLNPLTLTDMQIILNLYNKTNVVSELEKRLITRILSLKITLLTYSVLYC